MQDNVIFQKGRMTKKRMFGLLSIWFLVSDDLCTICFIEGYAIFTSRLLQGVNWGSNMCNILNTSYNRLLGSPNECYIYIYVINEILSNSMNILA